MRNEVKSCEAGDFQFANTGAQSRLAKVTNPPDQFPVLLLLMLGGVFGIALAKIVFVRRMAELRRKEQALEEIPDHLFNQPAFPERPEVYGLPYNQPDVWLAIRNRNVDHILEAFGMQNITPCTWEDGLENTDRRGIFVSPPIGGWTLVLGPRLPDLSGDVDALFRFITQLSARLGHVQYFHSNAALHHHAWVRSEYGRIHRAFAWTNQTVWNQGRPTLAEAQLGMISPGYGEPAMAEDCFGQPEFAMANAERIPALAARWSVNLAAVNTSSFSRDRGVAGDPRLPGLG